jgi:hypothetical protein
MAKIENGLRGTIVEVSQVEKIGEKQTDKMHFIFKVLQNSTFEERDPEYWKIDIIGTDKIKRFLALAPGMEEQKGTAEVWINSNHVVRSGITDLYIVNVVLHEFKIYENVRK